MTRVEEGGGGSNTSWLLHIVQEISSPQLDLSVGRGHVDLQPPTFSNLAIRGKSSASLPVGPTVHRFKLRLVWPKSENQRGAAIPLLVNH